MIIGYLDPNIGLQDAASKRGQGFRAIFCGFGVDALYVVQFGCSWKAGIKTL